MTSRPSVGFVARQLRHIARIRHGLLSVASGVAVGVIASLLHTMGWPAAPESIWRVGAAAVVTAIVFWWLRIRAISATPLVAALWIEEQSPGAPDFSLVTWVEEGCPSEGALARAAHARLAATDVMAAIRQLAYRQCASPLVFLLGALLLWWRAESASVADAASTTPRAMPVVVEPADRKNVLHPWDIEVVPPSYAMRRAERLGDASSVRALAGSRLVVSGAAPSGDTLPLTATVRAIRSDSRQQIPMRVDRDGDRWLVRTTVQDIPSAMVFANDTIRRQLVIEGVADTIPRVTLQAPIRDSVFRTANGTVPLAAAITDDIGLANALFEVVITSGEGERFTVRTVAVGTQRWSLPSLTRRATVRASLDLATLGLQPGDVLHVRAMARDHHPDRDRDLGRSETRAFRIARPSEYDSVAVEPAPPPAVDTSLISQRMLLLLTQKLDRRQRAMPRPEVVREAQRLARDQARLRLAVGDVVFQRLSGESSAEHAHSAGDGHDHGVEVQGGKLTLKSEGAGLLDEGNDAPVIAINQPLLEAYNAMWDAGRALEQGDPHAAIPPMQRALEAIERSRAASRLYLRGRPPQVIVDIAKVRLTGRDTGSTASRSARGVLPAPAAARDRRLMTLLTGSLAPVALRDSLALLRIEALGDAPAFASALGSAIDALAAGRDLTPSLVRARRALGVVQGVVPSQWTRGVPRQ